MRNFTGSPRLILCALLAAGTLAIAGFWRSELPATAGPSHAPLGTSSRSNQTTPSGLPADIPASWYETVRTEIARAEYGITYRPETDRFSSPNRSQNLMVSYAADGFSLLPRTSESGDWNLDLRLESIGRGGEELTPGPIAGLAGNDRVCVEEERMSVRHDGFRIDYSNNSEGMRQDFIVERRPDGDGPLKVKLRAEGNLRPTVQSEDAVLFAEAGSDTPALWYKGLKAWDAEGTELAAHMEASDDLIALVVDDAGAKYPVTVDPISSTPNWKTEGNEEDASFGFSVSGAGDVNNDGYDDVIVGAYEYIVGQTDEGRAFVYHGSSTGLSTTPAWNVRGNVAFVYLGYSVSGAGDVNNDGYDDVIVGAYQYSNGQDDEGRAYVYHGSSSGLSTTPAWTGEINHANAWFGCSVSGAGDVNNDGYDDVIVGALGFTNGQSSEGAAYVYHGSSSGLALTHAWTVEGGQSGATFGNSVANAGDVNGDTYDDVIVGARAYDNGQNNEGRAFIYHGSTGGLATTVAWTAESDQVDAAFGYSVDGAGDVNNDGYDDVIVGANAYDNGQTNEGRAWLYHGSPAGASTTAAWTAESNQASSSFGCSVASAGDVNNDGYDDVIIGAMLYDNGQNDEGRAFIYYGSTSGLAALAAWTAEINQGGSHFGISVAHAGDVNGDSYSDVIIGAEWYQNPTFSEGGAFTFHGAPGGTFSGIVVNEAGTRIAGATVKLDNSLTVTTDANGEFRFATPVSPGIHSVEVSATGFQTAILDLNMPNSDKSVVIGLSPEVTNPPSGPYTICGTVTSTDGNGPPLSGVTVEVLQSGSVVATTSTDAQGKFCSAPQSTGSYQVRFTKAGYETLTMDLMLDANKQIVVSLVPANLN